MKLSNPACPAANRIKEKLNPSSVIQSGDLIQGQIKLAMTKNTQDNNSGSFSTLCRSQDRGNQYIQLVKVLYCKMPANGKQLQ